MGYMVEQVGADREGGGRGAQALPIFGATKTQSRFASVVFYGVLGPPHLVPHT